MMIGVAGLVIALVVGGFVLYGTLRLSVTRALDDQARAAAAQVVAMVDSGTVPDPLPVSGVQVVQVVDEHNRVLDGSVGADRLTALLHPDEIASAVGGSAITVPGSRAGLSGPLRVVAERAGTAAEPRVVIAAVPVSDIANGTAALRTALLNAFPLLLVVLAAIAWFVIGWTLRPVEELRAAAERIGGTGRDERLPVPASQDEIRSLAETLNTMLSRLAAARARQRDFVADAAHELRSPLASIRTQLEVSHHLGGDGALATDQITDLLTDVLRLSRIVEDLLLLARADADGGRPPRPRTIEVRALLGDVANGFSSERSRIAADSFPTVRVADGEPVEVSADPEELRRAVTNLVDNAVRYARTEVVLDARRIGDHVTVSVTDDGPGIEPADRERVFDRFTRLDQARGRDTGGSGLGLAIVRELVRRGGGTVAFHDADPPWTLRADIELPAPRPTVH
jgi:signal transduction histidine kinase